MKKKIVVWMLLVVLACLTCSCAREQLIQSRDFGSDDAMLLMQFAEAELGGAPAEDKALLMLIVLNRVWHPNYPNSIEEVIGAYEKTDLSNVVPDANCEHAIELIYSGWDKSHGTLIFPPKNHMADIKMFVIINSVVQMLNRVVPWLGIVLIICLLILACIFINNRM